MRTQRVGVVDAQGHLRALRGLVCIASLGLASACATTPPPLPTAPALAADLSLLSEPVRPQNLPGLAPHRLSLEDGLDETETAMLAVTNNPELRALRAAAGVADATLFAAGLLPDPQFGASADRPDEKNEGVSGTMQLLDGYSLSLGFDLSSLITLAARRRGARATYEASRMDLVWAEWQVAQEARTLHRQLLGLERRSVLLKDYLQLAAERYARSRDALIVGDVTLDRTSGELIALVEAQARAYDQELLMIDTQQAFRALLGLTPTAAMPRLSATDADAMPGAAEVESALATLSQRRPDLRALAAGYDSQDAKLRTALLNRLPNLSVSLGRARDTSGISMTAVGVGLSLPFFDGNRGTVRIEHATLQQLRAEYDARLAKTHSDVRRLVDTHDALALQVSQLQQRLPALQSLADKACIGVDHHDLDPIVYLSLRSSLLTLRFDIEDRVQAMVEDELALSTLLGLPPESWMHDQAMGAAR